MLLIKNPWGHFSWRGKYSYGDTKNWTPELKQALGYENFKKDHGVFWMDWESVQTYFEGIDMNWEPELFIYQKSFFDMWKQEDMNRYDTRSCLKACPQFYLKFFEDQNMNKQFMMTNANEFKIKCWVSITKLQVVHSNGDFEQEENSKDYMAMHVYPNDKKNQKIDLAGKSLIRSTYRSDQTVMLRMKLGIQEYFKLDKVLNLVLDQMDRTHDLYYQLRVFSSHPFEMNRIGQEFCKNVKI